MAHAPSCATSTCLVLAVMAAPHAAMAARCHSGLQAPAPVTVAAAGTAVEEVAEVAAAAVVVVVVQVVAVELHACLVVCEVDRGPRHTPIMARDLAPPRQALAVGEALAQLVMALHLMTSLPSWRQPCPRSLNPANTSQMTQVCSLVGAACLLDVYVYSPHQCTQ